MFRASSTLSPRPPSDTASLVPGDTSPSPNPAPVIATAGAVRERPPIPRKFQSTSTVNAQFLRATAVEIASRTPGRVRKACRPLDAPRPLVARFGNARFGPRARTGGTGAPEGRPAEGSPDAAGRWAARDSSAQGGGRPRGAGGIQSVGVTCIGSAEAWSAAAVGIISALGSRLSALGSRLSALGSQLSALSSQLSALSSQLSALSSQLSALSSQLSALSSQLSALSSQLSALSSQLSALSSQLSALSSLLIASSEFAPDAPSCGVRIAASDCAVAGARPSTASRSIRIDIRPFGESDGSIFDLYGHMINRNVLNPLPPRRIGPGHGGEMVSGCRPWPGPVVLGIGDDARGPRPAGPCLRRRTARPRPRVRCGRGHPGERGQDAGLEADAHGRARREFPPRSATARMLTGEPSEPHRPGNALRRDQPGAGPCRACDRRQDGATLSRRLVVIRFSSSIRFPACEKKDSSGTWGTKSPSFTTRQWAAPSSSRLRRSAKLLSPTRGAPNV